VVATLSGEIKKQINNYLAHILAIFTVPAQLIFCIFARYALADPPSAVVRLLARGCLNRFLGQALPSGRSWLSLLVIVLGAILYVVTDDGFQVTAYVWVVCYFLSITAEMVYVKFVVDSVEMTTWGRV
jgi:hypothetical protein